MNIAAKLPTMEDASLAVLHENAARLEHSGTSAQKTAAAALIPAIEEELATRRAAKLNRAKETAAAKRRAKPVVAKPRARRQTA